MGGRMGGWAAPRWGKRIDVQVSADVASDGSEAAVHGGLAIKRWALQHAGACACVDARDSVPSGSQEGRRRASCACTMYFYENCMTLCENVITPFAYEPYIKR